jgi:hypothetical protein
MVLFLGSEVGGKVLSTGSLDISGLNWNNSSVGVGNKAGVSSGICVGGNGETESSEVLSTGSLDSGLINGDNSSIGVGNKARVGNGVVDVVVVVVVGVSQSAVVSIESICVVGIVVVASSIRISVSGKVSSLGSLDLKGLDWSNSTVGVGNELGAGSSHASKENLQKMTGKVRI